MNVKLIRRAHQAMGNVPLLRRIDAWVIRLWFNGIVPAARFVCQIVLLFKLAAIAVSERKRLVVLYRFGGIGDIICTFPAVREWVWQNPSTPVVYLTRHSYRGLLARSNVPVICVTSPLHLDPPAWATWIVSKSLHLSYADEFFEGAPPGLHLIEKFGRALGLVNLTEDPVLRTDAARLAKIRARHLQGGKKRIVLLHAGPTWKVKEWPLESWAALVARLNEDPGVQVLQLAADRNVTVKDASHAKIPGALPVRFADDMEKLIDMIGAADLLIGVDSGPLHIASAVGTNSVALFGPTDPAILFERTGRSVELHHRLDCSFCHHRMPRLHWQTGCPYNIACMRGIGVEQVLEKAFDLLCSTPIIQASRDPMTPVDIANLHNL